MNLKIQFSKRNLDNWKGCQGTCDFDPIPNTTGWI